jgi:hypothetical protein
MVSRIAGGDRMKITFSLLSVSFAGVLSGCSPVVSIQPLYTQAEIQKPYLNQQVEGEWIMANLDDSHEDATTPKPHCRVSISKSSVGEVPYAVEFRCPASAGDSGYRWAQRHSSTRGLLNPKRRKSTFR